MNSIQKAASPTKPVAAAGDRQIDEIRAALAQADAGDFVDDAELAEFMHKWGVSPAHPSGRTG